ncbi:hypothetical protein M758_10G050900 [Ceratodon purpureus]|nr:hypothetical protein M758_10G050900 [Ceratodon purpureus]
MSGQGRAREQFSSCNPYINYGTDFDKVGSVEPFRVKVLFPAAMAVSPARLPTSSTVLADRGLCYRFFDLDTVEPRTACCSSLPGFGHIPLHHLSELQFFDVGNFRSEHQSLFCFTKPWLCTVSDPGIITFSETFLSPQIGYLRT